MPDLPDQVPATDGQAPRVVHCRRAPPGSFVLVDRTTVYGNPYRLTNPTDPRERAANLRRYRRYFLARVNREPAFREAVERLRGKDLGCHCAPRPCHAQVILDYLAAQPPMTSPQRNSPRRPARGAPGRAALILDEPRVLVCGSRDWLDPQLVWAVLDHLHDRYGDRLVIIEGCAPRGADKAAHDWCIQRRLPEPARHRCHPANWDAYPRHRRWRAGHDRNTLMYTDRPQLVVAFHDALAPDLSVGGTADSLLKASLLKIPTYLIRGRVRPALEEATSTRRHNSTFPLQPPRQPRVGSTRTVRTGTEPFDVLGGWFALPSGVPASRLRRIRNELLDAHLLLPSRVEQPDLGLTVE